MGAAYSSNLRPNQRFVCNFLCTRIGNFAKAFDKVQYRRLLHRLDYYGIRGCDQKRISSWLSGGSQQVVLDGQKVSEYDQEIPQSHTADQPTAP